MIKRLLKSVREFKKDALLTPFFVVLEVVMEVIIPLVMALLIDKGIDGQDMAAIWKYGIILVLCAMLALMFGAAAGTLRREPQPALPAICVTICTTMCRISRFPTLISSPPVRSSPV